MSKEKGFEWNFDIFSFAEKETLLSSFMSFSIEWKK